MASTLSGSGSDQNVSLETAAPLLNRSLEEFTSPTAVIEDPEKKYHPAKQMYEKLPQLKELFTILGKVGEGTFSSVYVASLIAEQNKKQKTLYAIKYLVPTCHPNRIERELRCLKLIGGSDNVIGVDFCLRINDNVAFIMPFMRHERFNEYFAEMDAAETAMYIKNLLIALKRVHSFGIIHRDVKPSNFLYNRNEKKFLLVDFGLAQDVKSIQNKDLKANNKRKMLIDDIMQPLAKRLALSSNALITPVKGVESSTADKENIHIKTQLNSIKSPFKSPFKNYNSLSPSVSHKYHSSAKKSSPVRLSPQKNQIENKQLIKNALTPTSHIRKLSFEEENAGSMTSFIHPSEKCFTQGRNLARSAKLKPKPVEKHLHSKSKVGEMNVKGKSNVCQCFRKPKICNVCMAKKPQYAQRAGTPGFRPPEVLLKYTKQNTGVDIWAVGVILISILSGCYPFFRAVDDLSGLAEMITLFGTTKFESLARFLGISFTCTEKRKTIDLKFLCMALRKRVLTGYHFTTCKDCKVNKNDLCVCAVSNQENVFPNSVYDLLNKLLDLNPHTRISAEDALKHPFLSTS